MVGCTALCSACNITVLGYKGSGCINSLRFKATKFIIRIRKNFCAVMFNTRYGIGINVIFTVNIVGGTCDTLNIYIVSAYSIFSIVITNVKGGNNGIGGSIDKALGNRPA